MAAPTGALPTGMVAVAVSITDTVFASALAT
jgi:hypothetical protein